MVLKKLRLLLLSLALLFSIVLHMSHSTVSAESLPILSELEDNDTFENANIILLDRKYTGTIESYSSSESNPGSSTDYYKFSLPADGNIIVSIKNELGKNWYVDILTPDRIYNTIFSNNFSMETVKPNTESNQIEVGLPAGTYYLKITGSSETVNIPYYFETTYLQGSNFEKEPNDTLDEATLIEMNTAYSGVIEDYYDTWTSSGTSNDYYRFTLSQKSQIAAGIKSKKNASWYMELYNSTGDRLQKFYSDPNSQSISSTMMNLEAGTYYVRISGFNDVTDKPYRFMMSNEGIKGLEALNEIPIYIDGALQTFPQSPIIKSGTTLVPMRAIFEKLGATVVWNSKNKVVTAKKDNIEIVLTIDSTEATVNGKKVLLAQPAEVRNGSTMVPLRFISEALGANVMWFPDTTTVYIRSK